VRLLLDTQLAVWWQIAPERVQDSVRTLVQSADAVHISRASLWELAIKSSMGRLQLDLPVFCNQLVQDGFLWLDIQEPHLLQTAALPLHDDHKDPFDRLLVAQSLSEPLILLTTDTKLARYGSTVRVVPVR
jgi:PIN domain nuclease of toxin-antitoxin system